MRHVRRMYDMDFWSYELLYQYQKGVCAICGEASSKGPLEVDHDHRCCPGKRTCGQCVRGLLCSACNRGIGNFRDDPLLLINAVKYVKGLDAPAKLKFYEAAAEGSSLEEMDR
jgi:hypothetical protein